MEKNYSVILRPATVTCSEWIRALAEYDKPENGGITTVGLIGTMLFFPTEVMARCKPDGVSESGELHSLLN